MEYDFQQGHNRMNEIIQKVYSTEKEAGEIVDRARDESRKILAEAEKESASLLSAAREKAESLHRQTTAAARSEAEELHRTAIEQAQAAAEELSSRKRNAVGELLPSLVELLTTSARTSPES